MKIPVGVDTSDFAQKVDLTTLKSDVDKLDLDKLVPAPVDLDKLSEVVKNDVFKKYIYNAKINDIEDKIPGITNLAANTSLAKINEVKIKIPNVTNLTTTTITTYTAAENKKSDHSKYITTLELNKLAAESFAARLTQVNLASKSYIANFLKKTDFDDKIKNLNKNVTSNKTKNVLAENKLNELSKKFKAIPTKGLTKDLINGYKILNDAKMFFFRNISKLFGIYTN